MEYEIGVDESVSTAVVRAVSAVDGRLPGSIRPLEHVLDTDALNALFAQQHGGEPRVGGRLSFVFGDCLVTVDNGEYLTVQPLRIRSRMPDRRDDRLRDHVDSRR